MRRMTENHRNSRPQPEEPAMVRACTRLREKRFWGVNFLCLHLFGVVFELVEDAESLEKSRTEACPSTQVVHLMRRVNVIMKDLPLQQHSLAHDTSFDQQTPMKPSQMPNHLSQPLPKRVLPVQSPELFHRDRFGSLQHSSNHLGQIHPSDSPTNVGNPINWSDGMTKDRLGPPQHSAQPPVPFYSSHCEPVSPSDRDISFNSPQPPGLFHHSSPQCMRDLSNYPLSLHIRREESSEAKSRLSHSGSKNVIKTQESNKAQSSDMRSPVRSHSSERSSCSSLPISHTPAGFCQDQQHKEMPSHEKFIPGIICSSQKRRRVFEDCDNNVKKLCLLGGKSGEEHTPKPTINNSVRSSAIELPCEARDNHKCSESRKFKSTQSSCASPSRNPCLKKQSSSGAKQAYISSTQDCILKLKELKSSIGESFKKAEENNTKDKLALSMSAEVPQRQSHRLSKRRSSSVPHDKRVSRKPERSSSKLASNPNSCDDRTVERHKICRPRKSVVIPDDTHELFTPDPLSYVSVAQKIPKPKKEEAKIKSHTSEKSCSPSSSETGSLFCKTAESSLTHAHDTKNSSSARNAHILSPTVALERLDLNNMISFCLKDRELQNGCFTSSGRRLKKESVKSGGKRSSKTDTTASERTHVSHCSQCSPPLVRQESEELKKQENEEDAVDMELDLGLSLALDLDVTQSSHSSEDGSLLSLHEIMKHVSKLPDTPEKEDLSGPSRPAHHSSQSKSQLPSVKPGLYKNNLDQMLNEIHTNKKAKQIEVQLLTACQEDLLRIAEYETEEKQEGINTEQQEFLQRYSLTSSAIRDVPPGETVFNMEKFGQIFSQDTLQLRHCMVTPQGTAESTLLWSSPAQLKLHVMIGLFQEAYNCSSPCPAQVTRFLFKMMSVHDERLVSQKILQALCDIACTAANQIVENQSQQFKVWIPSLADVTLVLMNMGVAFVTLFPFENMQPPFTEGDLLEDISIQCDSASSYKEQSTVPEHNYNNVLKYLSFCLGLNPRAYSDDELLLLLTVVGKVSLDTQLILRSSMELFSLQYKLVNNIRDWDTMMPRICLALTDLTKDHHNMCLLVQLLPDSTRGKQLRQHLSLSMISKLLDGKCRPTGKHFKLSMLKRYLPFMQPSALLRRMLSSSNMTQDNNVDMATLDQQSYYLCYSLLTLTNEASNFQFFPAEQKEQLLSLHSELETHIKCDIRESEKCLYRSKVKDLVARIDTKWQMVLQKIRPLHDKLYDYWQPPVDTLVSSQEEHNSGDEEGVVILENKQVEETNEAEDNEVLLTAEEEHNMKLGETHGETEGQDPMDEKHKTEEAVEPLSWEMNQEGEVYKTNIINKCLDEV